MGELFRRWIVSFEHHRNTPQRITIQHFSKDVTHHLSFIFANTIMRIPLGSRSFCDPQHFASNVGRRIDRGVEAQVVLPPVVNAD